MKGNTSQFSSALWGWIKLQAFWWLLEPPRWEIGSRPHNWAQPELRAFLRSQWLWSIHTSPCLACYSQWLLPVADKSKPVPSREENMAHATQPNKTPVISMLHKHNFQRRSKPASGAKQRAPCPTQSPAMLTCPTSALLFQHVLNSQDTWSRCGRHPTFICSYAARGKRMEK